MYLETERVRNKSYTEAIDSRFQKHSQEYFVLAALRYFYPQKFDGVVLKDSPDLQDRTNRIGVEVTIAVSQKEMKASREFSKLKRMTSSDERRRIIEKIGAIGHSVKKTPIGNVLSSSGSSSLSEKQNFQEAVSKKLKKLDSYRKSFNKVGLAIYFVEIPSSEVEKECIDWLNEICKKETYDFYIVLSHRFFLFYEPGEELIELKICSCQRQYLSTIARMTAEKEISLSDIEWQRR